MGLRVKCIFSFSMIYFVGLSFGEDVRSSNSAEDSILKDALLLVKLLKSREPSNISALFPAVKISPPRAPESPFKVSPLEEYQPTSKTRTFSRNYRRMMSNEADDNVESVSPSLMTSEASPTNSDTESSRAMSSVSTTIAASAVQNTKSLKTGTTRKKRTELKASLHKSKSHLRTKVGNKTKGTQKPPKMDKTTSKPNQTIPNEDQSADFIIRSQVMSEMENEVKGLAEKDMKQVLNKKIKFRKPTLKVYLGRSTRFQLPLPPNHAFCFTNPNNGLCRSL